MKLKSYKAVLFDLDGTLLNTLDDLADTANRVLAAKGFPTHPLDAYRYFVGEGAAKLIVRALPSEKRHNDHCVQTCLQAFYEDYDMNWNVSTHPYKGIPAMLDALTVKNIKLAVLSNKPDKFTQKCAAEFLSKWNFEVVFGLRENVPRKPDPTSAFEVAALLNLSPSEFIYVGDTSIDMQTANAAGMFATGVEWGFRPVDELKAAGAQLIISHPSAILNLLEEIH
ncbi:HAD family hydrolase [Desulfococcaceae bacterium HSG7]|nr:HAD family hydrolase [Desulfococcaceae bacterium HSG7]